MKQKISPPARTARGVRSRGTTLFSPGGALGACNGAKPSRPTHPFRRETPGAVIHGAPPPARSVRRLSGGGSSRLSSHPSLSESFTSAILRGVCRFVKRRRKIRLRRRNFHGEGAPALFPLTKFDRAVIIKGLSPIILEISQRGRHFHGAEPRCGGEYQAHPKE